MKKKGFTLVELLAVIVVLAIIALIAVPSILGVIDKAKKGALKDSAYGLVDAATLYYAQYGEGARFDFDDNGNVTSNTDKELGYKGKVENGTLLVNSKGKIMICINDGENAAYKNYSDTSVVVVTGKTCNVNVSETQVLLDGENTINEYTNQELTDLVDSLQQQIEELNNSDEWKLVGSVTGNATIALPSDFEELSIMVYVNSEWYTFNIPKIQLTSEVNYYTNGYSSYDSSNVAYYRHIRIGVSLTEVSIYKAMISDSYNGLSDKTSTATIKVYYR